MSPRLLRPLASGGFVPTAVAGLAAWYDASDAGSITLNGSTVSQWSDKSGNGRHQVQGTAAIQPNYNATGLNGRGTLTTTGTQWMQASAFATSASGAYTVLMVMKLDSTAGQPYVFQRGTVNDAHSLLVSTTNTWAARRGSGNQGTLLQSPSIATSQFYILTAIYKPTLSRIFSGNTQGTDNTTSVAAPTGNKVLTLFALDSATRAGQPGLAEFIYYHAELSDAQLLSARQYLARKWGLTL